MAREKRAEASAANQQFKAAYFFPIRLSLSLSAYKIELKFSSNSMKLMNRERQSHRFRSIAAALLLTFDEPVWKRE
jgi:hypothetical protein